MECIYTIGFFKAFDQIKAEVDDVMVNGEVMDVKFCIDDKGRMFAMVCKYRKTGPYRSCGHWHSGKSFYDVYIRKNFRNRDEGNEFFKKVKATKVFA